MEDKIRSALFRAYKEELGSDVMDYLYGLMESKTVIGLTFQLSVPEILRGIIKRKNRGEIAEDEAQKIIDSILLDIDKSKPTVFLHADNHFSAKIVKEKMKTLDIREKEALKDLKKLMEDD